MQRKEAELYKVIIYSVWFKARPNIVPKYERKWVLPAERGTEYSVQNHTKSLATYHIELASLSIPPRWAWARIFRPVEAAEAGVDA